MGKTIIECGADMLLSGIQKLHLCWKRCCHSVDLCSDTPEDKYQALPLFREMSWIMQMGLHNLGRWPGPVRGKLMTSHMEEDRHTRDSKASSKFSTAKEMSG